MQSKRFCFLILKGHGTGGALLLWCFWSICLAPGVRLRCVCSGLRTVFAMRSPFYLKHRWTVNQQVLAWAQLQICCFGCVFQVRLKYMFWVALEVSAWVLPRINLLWPTRKDSAQENKRSWQGYGIVLLQCVWGAFEVFAGCVWGMFEVRLRYVWRFCNAFSIHSLLSKNET